MPKCLSYKVRALSAATPLRARAKALTTTSTASASGVGRSSHISTLRMSSRRRHISDSAPARANATSMDVAATLSTDNVGESRSDRKACRQPSRSPRRALARRAMVYVAQSGGAHVLGSRSARSNNLSAALNFALRSLATGASYVERASFARASDAYNAASIRFRVVVDQPTSARIVADRSRANRRHAGSGTSPIKDAIATS